MKLNLARKANIFFWVIIVFSPVIIPVYMLVFLYDKWAKWRHIRRIDKIMYSYVKFRYKQPERVDKRN